MLSTTFLTPGVPHAELRAMSRSDQVGTLPLSVTSPPLTDTEIFCASACACRFNAASRSDLTATAVTFGESLGRNVVHCKALSSGRRLRTRVSHRLREGHELLVRELQGPGELGLIDRSAKDRAKPLRSAEQIDVLADEAGIDRGVEAALLEGNIRHTLPVRDIDEVERCGPDKVLEAGLCADIFFQMR